MESLSETLGITDEMCRTKRRFVKEEPLARLAIRRGKIWTPEEFKRSILDRLPKEKWNDTQKAWLQFLLECNGIVRNPDTKAKIRDYNERQRLLMLDMEEPDMLKI